MLSAFSDHELDATDRRYLRKAFALAERGLSATNPNPRVGCVLVKGGQVLAEAFHQRAGQAHAERAAIEQVGDQAQGATAYVSLEPCSHDGKTPPCTDILLESGIARVVYGVKDINPLVAGRGAQILKDKGLAVVCAQSLREHLLLNPGYECSFRLKRPWLRLKLAISIDGSIALDNGQSQWISNKRSRLDNQRWRARSDAILSTWRSVMADDALLNVRHQRYAANQPTRVVIDRSLKCQPSAQIFSSNLETVLLLCAHNSQTKESIATKWAPLCAQGLRIVPLGDGQNPTIFFDRALELIYQHGLREIQIEAGGGFSSFLLENEYVDELLLYQAPKLMGGASQAFYRTRFAELDQCQSWSLTGLNRFGDDLRLQYLHPRWGTATHTS